MIIKRVTQEMVGNIAAFVGIATAGISVFLIAATITLWIVVPVIGLAVAALGMVTAAEGKNI